MLTPLFRLLFILNTIARYRLDSLIPAENRLLPLLKAALFLFPGRWRTVNCTEAERLKYALQALGPIHIKMGQMLSTRADLLPNEYLQALATLQDQVPGFDSKIALTIVEKELKQPISELFSKFDHQPLASASVAQVHTAELHTGEQVVVKIIRPHIEKVIRQDISLLKWIARRLEAWSPLIAKFHLQDVISEYEQTILDELDLVHEANNTTQLGRNFDCSPLLYVPKIYWPLVTKQVMVMERIYGVPLTNIAALEAAGVDMKKLAERGVEIFFTQLFRDNFFHADMHPGNIYVSTKNPSSPQYIALDCAIIGSLSKTDQLLLAKQLMAFMQKDYEQLAHLMAESGWVPDDIAFHEFSLALQHVCEPIFDKPLDEIEFGPILVTLFRTARQFEIQALPQFVLLEKTLLHIEGLGRQIYPKLDIWAISRPMLTEWLHQQIGPEALLQDLKRALPTWIGQLPEMPQLAYDALKQIKHNNKLQTMQAKELQVIRSELQKNQRRTAQQRYLGCLLIGLAALVSLSPSTANALQDIPLLSWGLLMGGIILFNPFPLFTSNRSR